MKRAHLAPIVLAVLALAIAAAIGFALRPSPILVETAAVGSGPMRVWIEAEGKTRVRDRYVVSAPVPGRLGRIPLREGDEVARGSLIAEIDPLTVRTAIAEVKAKIAEARAQGSGVHTLVPKPQALAQARAQIAGARSAQAVADERVTQARAALAQAERERERARALVAGGDFARREGEAADLAATMRLHDLDAALLEAQSARSDVTQARAQLAELDAKRGDADYLYGVYQAQIAAQHASLQRLEDEATRTRILAPVSGRVLRVEQKSEAQVNAGAPIVELGDTRALEIVFDVLSSDAVGIVPGADVAVTRGAAAKTFHGRVRRIEPSGFTKVSALGVEEQRVNVIADIVGDPGRLGDQYRVEAQIELWSARDVTQIPISALFRCGDSWCAYVVADGQARKRTVTIDHRNDNVAEVRNGVRRGDDVVLHPDGRLRDGVRIAVHSAERDGP